LGGFFSYVEKDRRPHPVPPSLPRLGRTDVWRFVADVAHPAIGLLLHMAAAVPQGGPAMPGIFAVSIIFLFLCPVPCSPFCPRSHTRRRPTGRHRRSLESLIHRSSSPRAFVQLSWSPVSHVQRRLRPRPSPSSWRSFLELLQLSCVVVSGRSDAPPSGGIPRDAFHRSSWSA